MANFERKPNTGAAFKNDKKTNEKQPDYRGTINVDGVDKEISLWVKDGKKGKYFSIGISEPYKKQAKPTVEMIDNVRNDGSDLPF